MPIAMNFELLPYNNYQDKYNHIKEYELNAGIKRSKSPLFDDTNLPSASLMSSTLIKSCKRTLTNQDSQHINLEELSRRTSTHKISLPKVDDENWLALAASNEHLLVGGGGSTILNLFDFHGKRIRSIQIDTFSAFDLAWSKVLNAFLIAGYNGLQIYNVDKDELTRVSNTKFNYNKKDDYFWSIACYDHDVFIVLSDGLDSVWRLSLPTFERVQIVSGSKIRESDADDRISCIRTNGFSIGMTLRQYRTNQWRVDLFDYVTMIRTHRGLTIGYGIGAFNFHERCMVAPVDEHQWLVTGGYLVSPNAITLMNDRTGEVKQVERQSLKQDEFIANIYITENSKQEQIISMIIIDHVADQRQMHIIQQ